MVNDKDSFARQGYENLKSVYRSMGDHDLLVELAISQKYQEDHLRKLNGTAAKNIVDIARNREAIAVISATCAERVKELREKNSRRYIALLITATAVSGALGANSDLLMKVAGF